MSFCKNCGANIGDSKFCANCGASPTATPSTSPRNEYSVYYHEICDYYRDAKNLFVLGLLSLIFCMGIGIVFQIICFIKIPKLTKYAAVSVKGMKVASQTEIEMLRTAQRKASAGTVMSLIGFFSLILALLIPLLILLFV